jgi:hypothetical protein
MITGLGKREQIIIPLGLNYVSETLREKEVTKVFVFIRFKVLLRIGVQVVVLHRCKIRVFRVLNRFTLGILYNSKGN